MEEKFCYNCGSGEILKLCWVNKHGEVIDEFEPDNNPYYIGDNYSQDTYKCWDCGETF